MTKTFGAIFIITCLAVCCNTTDTSPAAIIAKDTTITAVQSSKNLTGSSNCLTAVYQILESSERFKSLTTGLAERVKNNGGTAWGLMLEGSPNPERDTAMNYSATYDIALHESYPDRAVNIARFSFHPAKKMLYEYDIANDSLLPISFNKQLLSGLCK